MNLLRLFPSYRRLQERVCAAEDELRQIQTYYAQEKDRYAAAREFDAQTVENMRASHREEVGRVVDLLEKEREERKWAVDRLLELQNVRPIHGPSPRERIEAEQNAVSSEPTITPNPRQAATFRATAARREVFESVEASVQEYKQKKQAEKVAAERAKEAQANGGGT